MAVISTGQLSMSGAPTYIGSTYTGYYSVNVDLSELEYGTTYAVQGSGRFNNGTSGVGTNYAFDTKWVASENGEIPITFNATSSGKVEVTKTNLKFTVPIKRTQSDISMSLTCTLTFEKKVYNKVVYSEETLIDLTGDTVTADKLMQGYTAHDRSGAIITGTATGGGTGAISVVDTEDTHGGTIRTITAVDISDTTAVANDVAQGKYFYTADGTKTEGTSSGGGSVNLKMGVIRPDAELVQRWSGDELAVENLGLSIPEYSTSVSTLKAGAELTPSTSINSAYRYYYICRTLSIPIYSTTKKSLGRQDYNFTVFYGEPILLYQNDIVTLGGSGTSYSTLGHFPTTQYYRTVFWRSSSSFSGTNTNAGVYQSITVPSYSSSTISLRSPSYHIKGDATYLSSSNWGLLTDIRYQWIVELYRVEKDPQGVNGWNGLSVGYSILNDIKNNNGTLT